MKTTCQIVDEIYNSDVFIGGLSKRSIEAIDLIKLDAFNAGAEWAAKIVLSNSCDNYGYLPAVMDSILSASSNLKEIPK